MRILVLPPGRELSLPDSQAAPASGYGTVCCRCRNCVLQGLSGVSKGKVLVFESDVMVAWSSAGVYYSALLHTGALLRCYLIPSVLAGMRIVHFCLLPIGQYGVSRIWGTVCESRKQGS